MEDTLEEKSDDLKENENKKVEESKETNDNKEVKENVEKKEDDKEALKKELEETEDRLKRIMAEFENYKKRSLKERDMLYSSILADIVSSFLPIIDNLQNATEVETNDESYKQGVELVLKQFSEVLTKFGVEEIKTVGETFDPELHEAVSSIQDETKGEKEIVQDYRKGYKIGTKVIRHSMVVVAN